MEEEIKTFEKSKMGELLDRALKGEDITALCNEYGYTRSAICRNNPDAFWDLYCEDRFCQ